MRILFWFLFFYIVYRIVKIFHSARIQDPSTPQVQQTDTYEKRPKYQPHDIIDAEFKEIEKK